MLWEQLSHSSGLTSKEASGASLFCSETSFSIKENLPALVILGFWVGQMSSILKSLPIPKREAFFRLLAASALDWPPLGLSLETSQAQLP